jgi:2-methylisocitrate lyase-like PEP mutase family enzyme
MSPRKRLRQLLEQPQMVPLVGAYDALSAMLVAKAGFPAVYISGYNVAASQLGMADVGFLTLPEIVRAVRTVAARVDIPIVSDGDDGYGGYLNVSRLIRELEQSGASGMHIEDQVLPKRCGHLAGKKIIPKADMVNKIKAAVDARRDQDFVIIARTDAIAVSGFDDAIDRASAYAEAGADVLFVEAMETEEQIRQVPGLLSKPVIFNWFAGGKCPAPPIKDLQRYGFKLSLIADAVFASGRALAEYFDEIKRTGTSAGFSNRMMSFDEMNQLLGIKEVEEMDRRFGVA